MKDKYNDIKNQENIAKHGISFDAVAEFELETAITRIDDRLDYGEVRYVSYGMRNNRLYVLVWTERDGELRPISFRKANKRERKRYEV